MKNSRDLLKVGKLLIAGLVVSICLFNVYIPFASVFAGTGLQTEENVLFHLSFNEGWDAVKASGDGSPEKIEKASFTEGLLGKAAYIPPGGYLLYKTGKNLSKKAGTISMWVKLNWTPTGNGTWGIGSGWHGLFNEGGLEDGDSQNLHAMIGSRIFYAWRGLPHCGSHNVSILNRMWANHWYHLAFTWQNNGQSEAYIDGQILFRSAKIPRKEIDFGQIYIGSSGIPTEDRSSLDGVVDEIKIYDRPLNRDEIISEYARFFPIHAAVWDRAGLAGKENSIRIQWLNFARKAVKETFELLFRDTNGVVITQQEKTVSLLGGESRMERVSFIPQSEGQYYLEINRGGKPYQKIEFLALPSKPVGSRIAVSQDGTVERILLDEIDLTESLGPDRYRDDGECHVVSTKAGRYRESKGATINNGFACRFKQTLRIGQPHWLEVEYPDDKTRTFYVVVFNVRENQIVNADSMNTIGILTGNKHPLTYKMQTKRLLFWPDSPDIMVGCYAYREGTPIPGYAGPALSKIRLYENKGQIPSLKVNSVEGYPERRISLWDEDPTMPAKLWFGECFPYNNIDLKFWRMKWERILSYLYFTGMNSWTMLAFDYEGDTTVDPAIFDASTITSFDAGGVPGWADVGAVLLEREGFDFFVSVHDNSNYCGRILRFDHHALAKTKDAVGQSVVEGAVDSRNPIHPGLQSVYEEIVRTYNEKFGHYKRYRGIHFISYHWSSLYFHSLKEGYDDYNSSLFEKETGIKIPVDSASGTRYSDRYEWLMKNAREEWIEWRTRKILEFHRKLRDIVQEGDPSRMLIISLRAAPEGTDYENMWERWPGPEADDYQYWRECGIDFKKYAGEKGIVIKPVTEPNVDHTRWEYRDGAPIYNWRYFCYAPEISRTFKEYIYPAVMVSRAANMETGPWQPFTSKSYWWPFGTFLSNNGVICCFPTALPIARYVLEDMAHVLADFDPLFISHGWWGTPEAGEIEEFQRFYKAYRSIPGVKFSDVPGSAEDPVKLRYYKDKKNYLFYLVNREYYPVTVLIRFQGGEKPTLFNITADKPAVITLNSEGSSVLNITLKPYEVVCYRGEPSIAIESVKVSVPADVVSDLKANLGSLEKEIEFQNKIGGDSYLCKEVVRRAKEYLSAGSYSRLHYILQSGPVVRLRRDQEDQPRLLLRLEDEKRYSASTESFKKESLKPKVCKAVFTKKHVVVDGDLNEDIWSIAPAVSQFFQWGGFGSAEKTESINAAPLLAEERVELKVSYDEKCIYAAFTCYGKPPYQQKPKDSKQSIFSSESVEILFSPKANSEFYKIAVDVPGFKDTAHGDVRNGRVEWYAYPWENPGVQVATRLHPDSWTVEIALPFASIGIATTPDRGSSWKMNAFRNMHWRAEPSTAPLIVKPQTGIACVDSFWTLVFEK